MVYIWVALCLLFMGAFVDNARGPLIAHFVATDVLDVAQSSYILIWGHGAGAVVSLLMLWLHHYFHIRTISQLSLLAFLLFLLQSLTVSSPVSIYVFGACTGFFVAQFTMLSNMFAYGKAKDSQKSKIMLGLQSMYGAGSLSAAFIFSQLQESSLPWPALYLALLLPTGIVLFIIFKQPPGSWTEEDQQVQAVDAAQSPFAMDRIQVLILFLFSLYVASEVVCSMWMGTFLSKVHGYSVGDASFYVSLFFVLMMLSRVFLFFVVKESYENFLLWFSISMLFVGLVLALWLHPLAIILCGLIGPFFPIFMVKASRTYPQRWKAIMVWISLAVQILLALFHFGVGRLSKFFSITEIYTGNLGVIAFVMVLLFIFLHFNSSTPQNRPIHPQVLR